MSGHSDRCAGRKRELLSNRRYVHGVSTICSSTHDTRRRLHSPEAGLSRRHIGLASGGRSHSFLAQLPHTFPAVRLHNLSAMYIEKLTISNLRSLEKVDLSLNTPTTSGLNYPNVNVILGDNGLGKTSILRAAALATLGPVLSGSSGFVPDSLVRRRPVKSRSSNLAAKILGDLKLGREERKLGLPDTISLATQIERLGTSEQVFWGSSESNRLERRVQEAQFDLRGASFFIVGYGSTRRVEASAAVNESARIKSRTRRYERVSGLFEEQMCNIQATAQATAPPSCGERCSAMKDWADSVCTVSPET